VADGSGSRLRKRGGGGELESAGGMRWLLTYADMITLLLALFIILFAISTISKVKLQRLATDISAGFSSIDAINNPPNGGTTGSEQGQTQEANMASATQMKASLDKYIAKQKLQAKVSTRLDKQGLIITLLSDKTYYDSGSAELRPETKQLLDAVAHQLRSAKNDVRVDGYTDNVPIATSIYPTNWELSAARASGVTRYLVEHDQLSPARISLAGYGEFHPKYPNDTDSHRQQNRRVDIVILTGAPS
jgi:chemotaxis protein MotB